MDELDLISLWLALIMERMSAGVRLGLAGCVLGCVLSGGAGWVVIGLVGSGRHFDGLYCSVEFG